MAVGLRRCSLACPRAASAPLLALLAAQLLAGAAAEGVVTDASESREKEEKAGISSLPQSIYSTVVRLTDTTFQGNVLAESSYVGSWVVLFCVDWIAECRKTHALYAETAGKWHHQLNADSVMGSAVRFAYVDCAAHKVLCNTQNVDDYPFFNHYVRGRAVSSVSGSLKKTQAKLDAWLSDMKPQKRLMRSESADGAQRSPVLFGELFESAQQLEGAQRAGLVVTLLTVVGVVVYVALLSADKDLSVSEAQVSAPAAAAAAASRHAAAEDRDKGAFADRLAAELWSPDDAAGAAPGGAACPNGGSFVI
eukprot:TRINITY_DN38311_c0_g1_i1.p1 TRINITY_DN38311_c0_g1~~TRINITY_DN38311_c0_g1_i1.p1  ORF type:complete len:308 (+),score=64.70 TRINITY_DN38311_c0_g1_i1:94-1017(+)